MSIKNMQAEILHKVLIVKINMQFEKTMARIHCSSGSRYLSGGAMTFETYGTARWPFFFFLQFLTGVGGEPGPPVT